MTSFYIYIWLFLLQFFLFKKILITIFISYYEIHINMSITYYINIIEKCSCERELSPSYGDRQHDVAHQAVSHQRQWELSLTGNRIKYSGLNPVQVLIRYIGVEYVSNTWTHVGPGMRNTNLVRAQTQPFTSLDMSVIYRKINLKECYENHPLWALL